MDIDLWRFIGALDFAFRDRPLPDAPPDVPSLGSLPWSSWGGGPDSGALSPVGSLSLLSEVFSGLPLLPSSGVSLSLLWADRKSSSSVSSSEEVSFGVAGGSSGLSGAS